MRVLMVHSFHHPRGGDLTYTRSLARHLQARGHEVVPLSMRHPDNEPSTWEQRFPSWVDPRRAEGLVAKTRAALRVAWSWEAARAAAGLVRDARPDVAHVQHLHRHLTPSVLAPLRRAGVPIVWTVHDYELICPSGHLYAQGAPCERCRGHRYEQAVLQRCKWGSLSASAAVAVEQTVHHLAGAWQQVDRFLCPSRAMADALVRFGLPAERVEHLPNFVDLPPEPQEPPVPGEGWLYAGRLSEEKGVEVALQAARRLPGVPLRICGDGPQAEALRRQAADLPWVRFTGHLSPAALAAEVASARAVVVPSLWPENFPYAVLEAQAAGRAVVASRIGGIPEQIDDGVDGLLAQPGDPDALAAAVRRLLDQPDLAVRLGAAGRRRVHAALQPGPHLDRLLDLYAALVHRGRAAASPPPVDPGAR